MKKIKISKILISFSVLAAIACSKTEENVPLTQPTAEVTVDKIVRKASLRNQVIPFSILNEAGEDVTDASTFYVDGQEVDGNVFSSPIIGEFEVYGSYTENGVLITTNTVPFSVIIPKRKIVVEDNRETWGGFARA